MRVGWVEEIHAQNVVDANVLEEQYLQAAMAIAMAMAAIATTNENETRGLFGPISFAESREGVVLSNVARDARKPVPPPDKERHAATAVLYV